MKIETDNRPKGQKIEIPKTELTTVNIPKYINFGGHKIRTPKEIVPIHFGEYVVFGDAEVKNVQIAKQVLEAAKAKDEFIILFKVNKTKQGNCVMFSEKAETVISYRKMQLATALNLEAISKANQVECQTAQEFMQQAINSDSVGNELEFAYLTSRNEDLICKDIKRLVHITYEKTNVSFKGLSRANKTGHNKSNKRTKA